MTALHPNGPSDNASDPDPMRLSQSQFSKLEAADDTSYEPNQLYGSHVRCLKEALKEDREGTDGLAAMLVMMMHFKEAEEALFLLADATTTPADAEAQFSLPTTPWFIVLGDTVWSANRWMLSIEGCVVIPHSHPMLDFVTALAVLFASFYVFNIEYQVEAATTLEFIQRLLVRINPDSSKCSAKVQTNQKTGRTVKRKTSDMNPYVISFIRDFTAFDWQNN
ncbi:uncharacterized protein [Thunnus thynnus]|uniref:uncharacterized protein n=1 Tax=Thunnus thynnus TaxID=8237 RepID=UPI003527B811